MCFHLQSVTMHTNRHADSILTIENKTSLNNMDDLAIMWNCNSPGSIKCPDDVIFIHRVSRDGNHTAAVDGTDMCTCHTYHSTGNLDPRCLFCFLDRVRDRLRGCDNISYHPFPNAVGWNDPNPEDADSVIFFHTTH